MPLPSWMICALRLAVGQAACLYVGAVRGAEAAGDWGTRQCGLCGDGGCDDGLMDHAAPTAVTGPITGLGQGACRIR